ncbi:DUF1684 domain-containing protein [Pseudomonadota bacterium]
MKKLISMTLALAWLAGVSTIAAAPMSYEEEINDWRESRHERLSSESGWLTLVGLEWLQDGENRIGLTASSTIRIEGGPEEWGSLFVNGDELRFVPASGSGIMVDGAEAAEVMLVADNQGDPTVVSSGSLSFYVIFRESYALRIKDSQAQSLKNFTGVRNYEIQDSWKYEARFIPAKKGETIEIGDVLGHLNPSPVIGHVEFERDGKSYRLLGLGDEESESVWFLFADRTTGKETYGAGRFLYSDGLPENGRLVIDFNKAYNPPCAFNDYSTCPLPPQQNRLNLEVTAGEKDYHAH